MSKPTKKQLEKVYNAARGLCFGYDWNFGTHAGIYRKRLLRAVNAVEKIPDFETKVGNP